MQIDFRDLDPRLRSRTNDEIDQLRKDCLARIQDLVTDDKYWMLECPSHLLARAFERCSHPQPWGSIQERMKLVLEWEARIERGDYIRWFTGKDKRTGKEMINLRPDGTIMVLAFVHCQECGFHYQADISFGQNPLLDLNVLPTINVKTPRYRNWKYEWESKEPTEWTQEQWKWAQREGKLLIIKR